MALSSRMAVATAKVAWASTGGSALGNRWRKTMRACEAPSARAASTKSSCFSRSTSARTSRAGSVHRVTAIASTSGQRLCPLSAPSTARRKKSVGNVIITSVSRESTASVAPPRQPPSAPSSTPSSRQSATEAKPTKRLTRAP